MDGNEAGAPRSGERRNLAKARGQMIEKAEAQEKHDYSCEAMSLVVLIILSALSHFWYVVIAIGIGIAVWGAVALLGQALLSASEAHTARRTNS